MINDVYSSSVDVLKNDMQFQFDSSILQHILSFIQSKNNSKKRHTEKKVFNKKLQTNHLFIQLLADSSKP